MKTIVEEYTLLERQRKRQLGNLALYKTLWKKLITSGDLYIFTRQNDLRMPLVIRENEITAIRQVKKEIVGLQCEQIWQKN